MQKDFFLPKILQGDLHFSIGYTEPEAGTDLASVEDPCGARWRRVGHQRAEALHEPRLQRRLGVARRPHRSRRARAQGHHDLRRADNRSPGFKIQPYITMGAGHTTATFYDNVRVPLNARRRRGQRRLEPHHEPAQPRARVAAARRAGSSISSTKAIAWAKSEHLADGRRVIDQEWVQVKLAECRARVRFLDLFNWKVAYNLTYKGHVEPGRCVGREGLRLGVDARPSTSCSPRSSAPPATCAPVRPAPFSPAASRRATAVAGCSPSAAAPTRSNATSSAWPASTCRANATKD